MFKKISFFLIVFLALKMQSQIEPNIEPVFSIDLDSNTQVVNSKYFEKTNQYFDYRISESNELMIQNQIHPVHKTSIQFVEEKNVVINFSDSGFDQIPFAAYSLKVIENKKVYQVLKLIKTENSKYEYAIDKDVDQVCFVVHNRFSNLVSCQKKNIANNIGLLNQNKTAEVQINQKIAENEGVVLLQDFSKPVVFSVNFLDGREIHIQVIKRLPLMKKILKTKNSEEILVSFYDYNLDNYEWDDELKIDQTAFELHLNSIISVMQEISFSNIVNFKSSFDENFPRTYAKSTKKIIEDQKESVNKKTVNKDLKLSLGVVGVSYIGMDQFFDMSLVGKDGFKLAIDYNQKKSENTSLSYEFNLSKVKIINALENVPLEGADVMNYSLASQFHFLLNRKFSIAAGLNYSKYNFFKTNTALTGVTSLSENIPGLTLLAETNIEVLDQLTIVFNLEYDQLLSGEQVSSGSQIKYGIYADCNYFDISFFTGLRFLSKSQKVSGYNQQENQTEIYLGTFF